MKLKPVEAISTGITAVARSIKSLFGGEGSWRGPFSGVGELGGWHAIGSFDDGWQRNLSVSRHDIRYFGPVYACTAVIGQELSRVPVIHYRILDDGSRVEVTNKAVYRVFRKPNPYQTRSDFFLYMMQALLLDGNAYAVATRNDRGEVNALYPVNPRQMRPYIVEGEVFYSFGDQYTGELAKLEDRQWFAQRDVLHLRLFCPKHPLIGESPITAAFYPAVSGMEINKHNAAFFHNMSRPSGILRHPGQIAGEDALQRIKMRFMEVTQRGHTGEPVVLQENMDWKPLTMSAVDTELVKSYELTERQVAQIFRVPTFLLGSLEKATFQNVESLSRFFINSALGFYVDHWENAIAAFFDIPPNELVHFDVEAALLRGDLESRMAAYAKGVQNAIIKPNEARARENLPPAEYGDDLRAQQQLVPLSYGVALQPPGVEPPPAEPEPTEEQQLAAEILARKAIEKAMAAA